jgi:hypothetical protein
MSALATLTGFFIWIAVLSLPLAIYFLVILARRGKEVDRAHWADLRPIRGFPDEEKLAAGETSRDRNGPNHQNDTEQNQRNA